MKYFNSVTKNLFALLITSFLFHFNSNAQVTIGMGHSPAEAALLQLKDKQANPGTKDATASGGLLLPRVRLDSIDDFTLLPSPSAEQKKKHTGLLVYNLKEDANLHLEKGIFQWNGEQWKMLSKVTKTEGATVRKVFYRGTSPDATQTVELGIFEFRIDGSNAYPQFRRIPGLKNKLHYWQVIEFYDKDITSEGTTRSTTTHVFELKSVNVQDGNWTNCKGGIDPARRYEVWLADMENDNMYHIRFMILGEGGSAETKTYLITAQKY